MKKPKNYLIAIGVIIAILVLTNPTNSDFKSYTSANGWKGGGRIEYYGVFSKFKVTFSGFGYGSRTYIGVFKNFFYIK